MKDVRLVKGVQNCATKLVCSMRIYSMKTEINATDIDFMLESVCILWVSFSVFACIFSCVFFFYVYYVRDA